MGFWEASQSPPRHSTHHHRRRNEPRDENDSRDISYNRSCLKRPRKPHNTNSTLVELTSASQPETRRGIVKNWLEQTTRHTSHPRPSTSRAHRKDDVGKSCPSGKLAATAPYNKHPGRVDPRWDLHHKHSNDGLRQSGSPAQVLGIGDSSKRRRRRANPSDSSFISGFENSTKPPDYGPGPIRQDCDSTSPARPLKDAALAPLNVSSSTSYIVEEIFDFEKRPRRKTREDRYETKKKKRKHEREDAIGHDEHREKKRRKQEKKRKVVASGKNVVGNFTSEAVLNDRITVQPHLKPGLFDNKRTSKKQPITDLAFSEMQFLKDQKRNLRPKPLSKSRLREKRREDREMEEVSSFFLPHKSIGNTYKPRRSGPDASNDSIPRQEHRGKHFTSIYNTDLPKPLALDHRSYPQHTRALQALHSEPTETRSLDLHGSIRDEEVSSRKTTYFTWPSSRHSPQTNRRVNSANSKPPGSTGTTTPESIRRDLIATGIYRDTGIPSYDDRLTDKSREGWVTETRARNDRCSMHEQSDEPPKVRYRDQAIMTNRPSNYLELRQNTQEIEEGQNIRAPEDLEPQTYHTAQDINRQRIAREVRLGPAERVSSRQDIQASNLVDAEMVTEVVTRQQYPMLKETQWNPYQNGQALGAADQASIVSRDVMPPPPIPLGKIQPSTTGAGLQVEIPRPNTSSTSVPIEPSQAFHTAGFDVQQSLGPSNNPSQNALTAGPVINHGRPPSPFSAVSWLPQRTPSVQVTDKRNSPSRLSIKSPIYMDQHKETLSRTPNQRYLPNGQVPESMAQFIARIERESQLRSPLYNHDVPGSEPDSRAITGSTISFDTEPIYEQPLVYDMRGSEPSNLVPNLYMPYPYSGSPIMDQRRHGEFYVETGYPQYGIGAPRTLTSVTEPLEDFEDECFEMSNFWRPNQFSRF
ncbi:uncharacterized protein F4822DRAFT_74377 [Hypoxylon trugodes]|uniref:uncharacterized protein n=1 Tax=Hypoxylon trugodes TaxID=326681 RepID=UPI00218F0E34|nr:uncharacterized protein F4822DRAFT_74377 [Hypoxylon trugodes]KAI1383333.1 hypothetical protein F4822DRAFT_74377 [Hypoxylon trugodes]